MPEDSAGLWTELLESTTTQTTPMEGHSGGVPDPWHESPELAGAVGSCGMGRMTQGKPMPYPDLQVSGMQELSLIYYITFDS